MKILLVKDINEMGVKAAQIISDEIRKKSDTILGLATGSTPIETYKELIRMHREEGLDFSKVISFNLDEYYGINYQNPQSYHWFMNENLFNGINISKENIHIPDGNVDDVENYGTKYDEEIEKMGGIDIQLLGIGRNGHIGFNEPDDELTLSTHLTGLTQSTIEANSRFFNSIEEVPTKAVTMGLGTIMKARKILLLASGKSKAEIIGKLLNENRISTNIPASLLLLHNDVTVIIDEEAAANYKGNN